MTDPIIMRSTTRCQIGVEVDEMTVTLMLGNDTTIQSVPAASFALNGGFDGARLSVDRFYAESWTDVPAGNLNVFTGNIAQVEVTAVEITLSVKSELERLNMQLPRFTFTAPCRHTLFDPRCAILAATFTTSGVVIEANSTASVLLTDGSANSSTNYYNLGIVEMLDGPNAGLIRTIRSWDGANARLTIPLPVAPAPGNTVALRPGCDKRLVTCEEKFNNRDNFGGTPFIPVPESTM